MKEQTLVYNNYVKTCDHCMQTHSGLHHVHALSPDLGDNAGNVDHAFFHSLSQSDVYRDQGASPAHTSTGREGGREGGRERGREREREGGREGGREREREGEREGGREGGREGEKRPGEGTRSPNSYRDT